MKKTLLYVSFFLILVAIRARSDAYEEALKKQVTPVVAHVESSTLRKQVLAHVDEHEALPVEPRFDPVWKFVPGLQGVAFDVELSYQNMRAHGAFDASLMARQSLPFEGDSETFREHRIYKGNENSPYVALLINVAWGGDELLEMLDILDAYDVQASIFFEGRFADANHELVLEVFNRGHLIGNHSYSHPGDWLQHSYAEFEAEIVRTNEVLTGIIGEEIVYFAPPGGAFTEETIQAAYDQGMYTILWSADSIDWRGESAYVLVDRVMDRIGPGGFILTHPKPETVIALPTIITQIREEGYEFQSVADIVYGVRE